MARTKAKALNGEGSYYYVEKRGTWVVQFKNLDGKRAIRVAKPNTEAGARATLRKYITEIERGSHTPVRAPTLAEFSETWLSAKEAERCRPRTIESYRERMQTYIIPSIGALRLDKIQPTHLDTLYASLKTKQGKSLSSATVNSVHIALGSMLRLAHRRGLVPRVVTTLVTPPRIEKYDARTLTADQARTLINGLNGYRHGPLWVFLLGTGCRFGEATGLTWENVDLEEGTVAFVQQSVRVRTEGRVSHVLAPVKTRAGRRVIALPGFALDALKRQRELIDLLRIPNPHNLVFPSRTGTLLSENGVLPRWRLALEDMGLPYLRMHDLRHTKGTLMADAGEEITTIQRTLGHARLNITADIYVGNTSRAIKRAADRFNDMLTEDDA